MPEYKEYALQGGQPVRIQPFDAAEAGEGVHFAEEGCAFNPVIVAGGGGNPNYVETINGTMAAPWGNYKAKDVSSGINDLSITVKMRINFNGAWTRDFDISSDLELSFVEATYGDEKAIRSVLTAEWGWADATGEDMIRRALMFTSFSSFTDYTSMSANIPVITTIIHHPLPDSGT